MTCPTCKDLWLHDNQLTGAIPSTIGNLSNLKKHLLDTNQLTGAIPSTIGNLSNLEYLYAEKKPADGSDPLYDRQPVQPGAPVLSTNQ